MNTRLTALLAAAMIMPAAVAQDSKQQPPAAQPTTQPSSKPDAAKPGSIPPPANGQAPKAVVNPPATAQPLQALPQPAQLPPFESLAKKGPDGKVIRIEGILDIIALDRNPLIDEASRAKMRPMVKEWLDEVETLAIDNLDFMEMFEPYDGSPGLLDTAEIADTQKIHMIAQIMTQLMSAGPMSATLESKGAITRDQSMLNQQITSEYLQAVMNEIMADAGTPNDKTNPPANPEDKTKQINLVSRFLYGISCRDTQSSYHRMLSQAAPNMDKIVATLNLPKDAAAKIQPAVAQVKAAKTDAEKRQAVRNVMKDLPFAERQAVLRKAREMAPPFDPLTWYKQPEVAATGKGADGHN
jgi:hypothetical protein